MKIFVMRHGEAQTIAPSDSARPLTEKGKQQAYQQGQWLHSMNIQLDKVLVSPYLRAQQTFEQVNLAYQNQLQTKCETWEGITPYGDAGLVRDYLNVLLEDGVKTLLIISHLPLVGDIVRELCGRNPANFYPATLVEVDIHCEDTIGKVESINYPR
ncbi:phosphohistidine phosphatase SixA [Avibacterium sp. 20-15]|uniref:phosphohistidine phosphatase SixA n=1 Tax=unclassified Avibacterium TaxID=2685287 RepID=UPI0020272748|nr:MULTISPECIES: phosphohistidine phosphatase SixA [unclassified Avibacterium]MCW9733961.1 phosphohistidine phosphatase SixA [Avibacterium sp. 20-15]URL01088.1 phosphohistidine phosphatase SixA [Avibacterium sp. 20-126]URL03885.1 phosphohistidine phosphatase SixA [Avibacterium sp. 20-132]